jgi:hypothetical protein
LNIAGLAVSDISKHAWCHFHRRLLLTHSCWRDVDCGLGFVVVKLIILAVLWSLVRRFPALVW